MIDDLPGDDRAKRDRTARLLMVVQILRANGTRGVTPAEIAKRTGMAKRTVYRDLQRHRRRAGDPRLERGRPLGRGRRGLPAAAPPDPVRGDGDLPLGAAARPVHGQARPGACVGVHEARGGPAGLAARPRRADGAGPREPGRGPGVQPPRRGPHQGVGRPARRRLRVPARALRRQARARAGRRSGRTCSSRRCRPTRST